MRSLILLKVARAVLPVTTLFALYLLLRGHNEPGGGFIAGLVTAAALVVQSLAFGAETTQRRVLDPLRSAIPLGVLAAVAAALAPVAGGDALLTHYHTSLAIPGHANLHLSTTLLFDLGVYGVVVGVGATLLSTFARAGQ